MSEDQPLNTVTQFGRVPYEIINAGMIASLKAAASKVYLVLLAHTDVNWETTVGLRRIARLTGIHVGSASRAVEELKTAGLIETNQPINGQGFHYRITTDRSPVGERSQNEPFTGARTVDDQTVHPCANGQNSDRSPGRNTTVRILEPDRSHFGAQPFTGAQLNRLNREDKQPRQVIGGDSLNPDQTKMVYLLVRHRISMAAARQIVVDNPGVTMGMIQNLLDSADDQGWNQPGGVATFLKEQIPAAIDYQREITQWRADLRAKLTAWLNAAPKGDPALLAELTEVELERCRDYLTTFAFKGTGGANWHDYRIGDIFKGVMAADPPTTNAALAYAATNINLRLRRKLGLSLPPASLRLVGTAAG
jgi:hypothetical protein